MCSRPDLEGGADGMHDIMRRWDFPGAPAANVVVTGVPLEGTL